MLRTLEPEMTYQKMMELLSHDTCKKGIDSKSNKRLTVNHLIK